MTRKAPPTSQPPAIVDVGERVTRRAVPGRPRIELLTDPWSVWCWGFEPVRRALQLRHPEIEFRFLLGGMFETLPRPDEVGFDVERFFSIVQRTTGMPLRVDATRRDRPASTYPACVHVHAVRLLAPALEEAYLRALRESAYLDGRNISREDVAADVAQSLGLDRAQFLAVRRSPAAETAFRGELKRLQARGLQAYPTILFSWQGRSHVVEGFQSLPAVLGIVQSLTGRLHPPRPDPPLSAIVAEGERVATREIAEVLGIGVEAAYQKCLEAEADGRLRREAHATGVVWSRPGGRRARPRSRTAPSVLITPEP